MLACVCVCAHARAFALISKYDRSPHVDVGHCFWLQSSRSLKWLGRIRCLNLNKDLNDTGVKGIASYTQKLAHVAFV